MDISYLLLLQEFRNSTGNIFTPFLEGVSLFSITYLIMLPVLVYWMFDKRSGLYILSSYALSCAFNQVVKLTVCAFRPWIRNEQIQPAGDAVRTATGYSFPSTHTVTAGTFYGGMAVRARKTLKWVSVICGILFLLTAFSRNYLGVHTPQDVFAAAFESMLGLILIGRLFRLLEVHPERENLFLLISFILGWAALAYITFKPYPMTYEDGKLLADPQRMMNDGYADICLMIVFPIARFIERKWVNFKPAGSTGKGIVVCLAGLIPMWIMINFLCPPLDAALGSHWGHFAYQFIFVLYYVTLWPAVIKAVCGQDEK